MVMARNTKNNIFAISVAPEAIPPKPRTCIAWTHTHKPTRPRHALTHAQARDRAVAPRPPRTLASAPLGRL